MRTSGTAGWRTTTRPRPAVVAVTDNDAECPRASTAGNERRTRRSRRASAVSTTTATTSATASTTTTAAGSTSADRAMAPSVIAVRTVGLIAAR
jgi:hypothetical protein